MTKLEQLIEQLCPDGVEYIRIGELSLYRRGSFPQPYGKKDWYDGEGAMPFVQVADIGSDMRLVDDTKRKISQIAQTKSVFAPKGSIVISLQGSIGRIAITQYDAYIDRTVAIFYDIAGSLNKKFFVYQLQRVFSIKEKTARGSTIKTITKEEFTGFYIPVPPLEVQAEIVRILDTFTELTTELTTELINRKKQYEYYENTVLFDNNYPRIKLQELCTVNQGLQIPISERFRTPSNNRYIYITVQYLKNPADNQYYIENPNESVICYEDDILVTRTGSTGTIVTGIKGCFHNNFFKVQCNGRVLKKYMLVLLRSKTMYNRMQKAASGGNIMDLPHKKFYNLEVPLPSIEEQQRIVDILDRFDKLCNDISEGLPAEIEARQKQYEYYRDKLLTFKERKV